MAGKPQEVIDEAYFRQRTAYCEMRCRIGDHERAYKYWLGHYQDPPTRPYPECLKEYLASLAPVETVHVVADPDKAQKEAYEALPSAPTHSANGWPLETTGEVMRKCLNPQLVVARIADGRLVSMRQARIRPWKPGARVKMKLEKFEGDPLYRTY